MTGGMTYLSIIASLLCVECAILWKLAYVLKTISDQHKDWLLRTLEVMHRKVDDIETLNSCVESLNCRLHKIELAHARLDEKQTRLPDLVASILIERQMKDVGR